jgi:hypothetical protein
MSTEAGVRHTGMSRDFFIASVLKALERQASVFQGPSSRIGLVPSSEGRGQFYTVNKTWCSCLGHEHTGRCWHRAFYIFTLDVLESLPLERTGPEAEQVAGRTARIA